MPDILTGGEMEQLFRAIRSLKHRAILMTPYGAGLRISEACSLGLADLDSKRMLIHVHAGKRAKDRYVMLGQWPSTLARNDPPLLARSGPRGRVSGEGTGRQ